MTLCMSYPGTSGDRRVECTAGSLGDGEWWVGTMAQQMATAGGAIPHGAEASYA
jgi:hypothetical protein